ncbi:MAG: hypothetical protein RI580_10025 [Halothece sp. Uz-M2-17]|nr:hypothetical protein [Halothece sp. Uz-M2-17]
MIQSLQLRLKVDEQGRLQVQLPENLAGSEVDVVLVYQSVTQEKESQSTDLLDLYGCCADDPIEVDNLGVSDALDDNLIGVFDD